MIISIEGPDGCGKTTHAKMLSRRLTEMGYSTIYIKPLFFVSDILKLTIIYKYLSPRKKRVELFGDKKRVFSAFWLLSPFFIIYALLTYLILKYYFNKKNNIVCDRYFYQLFYDLFSERSEILANYFPISDVTFFLKGDLNLFYSRMCDAFDLSVRGTYYEGFMSCLDKIAKKKGFYIINARLSEMEISDYMLNTVVYELEGNRYEK